MLCQECKHVNEVEYQKHIGYIWSTIYKKKMRYIPGKIKSTIPTYLLPTYITQDWVSNK